MLVRGLKTAQIHALKLCAFHFRFHFVEFSSLFVPIAELGLVLFQRGESVLCPMNLDFPVERKQ